MRAAPTQKPAIASAEPTHLLPPPNAVGPIHNREEAHRRPVRRSSRQPCIRVRDVRFAVRQRIGQFWCRLCGPGGSRRSLRVFGHGCRLCDRLRRWWTEVITCHLRRPPVASALAAVHGIRRGLQVSAAAPAHAFGRQSRRVAPLTCVVRQSNALARRSRTALTMSGDIRLYGSPRVPAAARTRRDHVRGIARDARARLEADRVGDRHRVRPRGRPRAVPPARAEGRGPGRPSRSRVHARADREDPEVVHVALAQPRARHRLRARPDGVPAGQLGALRARGRAALRGHVRRVPALQPADVRHRRARLARLPVVRPHGRRHRDASPQPPARAVRGPGQAALRLRVRRHRRSRLGQHGRDRGRQP